MVLNLKIDKFDNIWFCWCSSIRSASDKKSKSKDPWMRMKPLCLNDNMIIPENALKSKSFLSPTELERIQERFKIENSKEKEEQLEHDQKNEDLQL